MAPPRAATSLRSLFKGEGAGRTKGRVLAKGMSGCRHRALLQTGTELDPCGVGEGIESWLSTVGSRQCLDGTVEADVAQRPTKNFVGGVNQKVGSSIEQLGAHTDFLGALAREQNGICPRAIRPRQSPARYPLDMNESDVTCGSAPQHAVESHPDSPRNEPGSEIDDVDDHVEYVVFAVPVLRQLRVRQSG